MKKSRSNSIKKILIIILALMISSFMGYRFALAQDGNALKSVVEPGSMTTEASYIIFTDGTDYYARNGTTGEIEFSGTNASSVILYAYLQTPNGGSIIVKGSVTIDTPLTFTRTIKFEEDGYLTTTANQAFIIGSSTTNPLGGQIIVTGGLFGNNATGSSIIEQISGYEWQYNINWASLVDIIWQFAPVAQGSDTWYAGNVLTVNGQTTSNLWYIPTEPAHVKIEGNKLYTSGTAHTLAGSPILWLGGAQNAVYGFLHSLTSTIPDINDTASRGSNQFYVAFLGNPTIEAVCSTDVVVYNNGYSQMETPFAQFSSSYYWPVDWGYKTNFESLTSFRTDHWNTKANVTYDNLDGYVNMSTGNDISNFQYLTHYEASGYMIDSWSYNRGFKTTITFQNNSADAEYVGMGDYLDNQHQAGFLIANSTINATVTDGSGTQSVSTGVTINSGDTVAFMAFYHNATHTIDFYVNYNYKLTLSWTPTNSEGWLFVYKISTLDAYDKEMYFSTFEEYQGYGNIAHP